MADSKAQNESPRTTLFSTADQDPFHLLFEKSPDAILILDDGLFVDCNEATLQMMRGQSKSEMLPLHPSILSPEYQPDGRSSAEKAGEMINTALTNGTHRFEWVHRRLDGEDFPVEVTLVAIPHEDKTILYTIWRDLTIQKELEYQVQYTKERQQHLQDIQQLSYVVEQSLEGRAVANLDGYITFVNQAWVDMHGYDDPAELLGQHLAVFHTPEQLRDEVAQFNQEVMETGQGQAEIGHVRKDGTTFPTWMFTNLLRDSQGEPIGLTASAQDITERKRTERLLAKQAEEMQTVAELSLATATILDQELLLQRVVDLTKERFGLYHAHIYLLDEAGENLRLTSGAGEVGKQMVAAAHKIPLQHEHSLVARAARTHQGVIVNDVQANEDFLPNKLLPETRAEMAVPMLVGNKLLGVLDVQAAEVDRFTEQDVQIQTTLATQTAVALQNVIQYSRTQAALAEANTFRQFVEASGQGIGWADLDGRIQYMNRALMEMLELNSVDEAMQHNSFEFYPPDMQALMVETIVPAVLNEGSWLGEVNLQGKSGRVLPTLHNLFVVYDASGETRYLGNVVTDISERKAAEEEQANLTKELEAQINQINTLQRAMTHEGWEAFFTAKERPIHGYLFDKPDLRPLGAADLQHHGDPNRPVDLAHLNQPLHDAMQTAVATPMRVRGEVIGVLGARHPDGRPLTEDQQSILTALSEQVAEALERTRLFEETELGRQQLNQRANELQSVAEITTAISSLLDEQQLLATVTHMTQRRFDLYHCHIFLVDDARRHLQIKACGWQEGDPHEGTHGDSIIRLDEAKSLVAQAARRKEPVVVNNVHEDPNWLPNELLPNTQSEMAVPLLAAGQVIGVLDVQSEEINHFSAEDVRIQMTLAAQIGVALQNVRQYTQAQRRANRERLINEISQKIQSAQTVQTALQTAVAELGRAINAQQVIVSLAGKQEEPPTNGS